MNDKRRIRHLVRGAVLASLLALVAACGSDDGDDDGAAGSTEVPTAREVDVIVAIDSSGTMTDEIGFVQAGINGFVATLVDDGVDPVVIVIAAGGFCAPAPLGSGACPADQNLPGYRHDPTAIGSTDALDQIIATHPNWSASLRASAGKVVIVVSDADSATPWETFDANLLALPTFSAYRFHAFAAMTDPLTPPCDTFGTAEGIEYEELATGKGGVFTDLCLQDFQPGFDAIAAQIVGDTAAE